MDKPALSQTSLPPPVAQHMDPLSVSPWLLIGGVFVVASLGGLAALLRSGQQLTPRQIFSALLNSGLLGIIIAMSLWKRYGAEDPFLLFGVSILAGFGGATTIDLITQYVRRKLGLIKPSPTHTHEEDA